MKSMLTITTLLLLCTVPVFAKTKDKSKSFDQVYESEVTAANIALKVYTNISCNSPNFDTAKANLITELKALDALHTSLPDTEDEILQAHQVELYLGFTDLTVVVIENQNECENPQEPLPSSVKNNSAKK